jgi:CDP-paratose 2-epimerase
MKILITGICGFVGSSLALRLRQCLDGVQLSGIDNLSRPGSEINFQQLLSAGIRVIQGDVRNSSDLDTLDAPQWIIHAAAIPTVVAGIDGKSSSRELIETNVLGTINMLELARRHGAGFVLLSSSRVYNIPALAGLPLKVENDAFTLAEDAGLPAGCSPHGISEQFSTATPISLYGASKLTAETLTLEYGQSFGFPVVINRCGVLAGGTQFGVAVQGIFSYWVRSYALRRRLKYIGFDGSGYQVRDALHPNDLTDLLLLQMQQPAPADSAIWNVGGGPANAMSLAQLSGWCAEKFGPHHMEHDVQPRPFDIPWMVMDSRRVQSHYSWQPQMPLSAILDEIAAHHQQHPDWLDVSQPK